MQAFRSVFSAFAAVVMAASCFGEVSMSDIWRWGLVRKSDILPPGATMTYPTNGVIRVTVPVSVVDSNRVAVTVLTNLVTGSSATLEAGTYISSPGEGNTFLFVDWSLSYSAQMTIMPSDISGSYSSTNALGVFPAVFVGTWPEEPAPAGFALVDWYRYTAVITNDFVCVDRLQDAIDDMRLEISEAIEAHVQLLHP